MNLLLASTLAVSGLILFTVIQEVCTHSSTKIRGWGRGKPRNRGNNGKLFGIGKTNSKNSAKKVIYKNWEKVAAAGAVAGGVIDVMNIAVS